MIRKDFFGTAVALHNAGSPVYTYTITSEHSPLTATVTDYGATLVRLLVPDRNGIKRDVVCGYENLTSYENGDGYIGATVGRVANRISKGRFSLDGHIYSLYRNDGGNHLHGGKTGFDKIIWRVDPNEFNADGESIVFRLSSPDGDEGYPGKLEVSVTYTLTGSGLCISYSCVTDRATPVNLTNHSYFNLNGSGAIYDTLLTIDADRYLPTDEGLIPTGEMRDVAGTPFDFRIEKEIGKDIGAENTDLKLAGGYDHCFVFPEKGKGIYRRVTAVSPASGIGMSVLTDMPAIQLYTGNFLKDDGLRFRNGVVKEKQHAFCLETEAMPDSVNHLGFTDTVLKPGDCYSTVTEYRFFAS